MKNGLGYRLFRGYVRFFHNVVYYRKEYRLGMENIPETGSLMIVSNHQNSLMDALGFLMAMNKRQGKKLRWVARADVFRPGVKKLLRWLGILPAFRLSYDGIASLSNNRETFREGEEELLGDGTLIIYPEAGHQDKHWLGKFSLGYLRILFEAAESGNFEKELFILPSCNHYSSYFGMREDILIRFGTPISIAPYYELYKIKPRTAQRQVDELVRGQVSDMMLNITDLENYDAIDFLRRNTYGITYAGSQGYNPEKLPEKLLADKQLFASLEKAKEADGEQVQALYEDTRKLEKQIRSLKLEEQNFEKKPSLSNLFLRGIWLLLLLPLFVFSCIPNIFIHYAPNIMKSKVKDKMIFGSIKFGMSVLISIPVLYLLTFILTWIISKSILIALIYLVILPFLGIFAWNFAKGFKQWKTDIRFRHLFKKGELNDIISLRTSIYGCLDRLLK